MIERPFSAHLADYYRATRTFKKFWDELMKKEAEKKVGR